MDKKYRLKRDLPTFKAGEVLELSKKGNLVRRSECSNDCVRVLDHYALNRFPDILNNSDWFEEITGKPKTVEDLKEGDKCWGIVGGRIGHWTDMDSDEVEVIKNMAKTGDAFLTKEEAEKELARREAKQILLKDTKGFKPRWYGLTANYEVGFDNVIKDLYAYSHSNVFTHYDLWFANEGDAKDSIRAHRKEWLIYLGVEE